MEEITVRIKTGDTTWAYVTGSREFCLRGAKDCYLMAKTLWPHEKTTILGLEEEEVAKIKRQAKKELRQ